MTFGEIKRTEYCDKHEHHGACSCYDDEMEKLRAKLDTAIEILDSMLVSKRELTATERAHGNTIKPVKNTERCACRGGPVVFPDCGMCGGWARSDGKGPGSASVVSHCENCGGNYVATGMGRGCACKILARAERAESERDEAVTLLREAEDAIDEVWAITRYGVTWQGRLNALLARLVES